jgi:hypothetical protein
MGTAYRMSSNKGVLMKVSCIQAQAHARNAEHTVLMFLIQSIIEVIRFSCCLALFKRHLSVSVTALKTSTSS